MFEAQRYCITGAVLYPERFLEESAALQSPSERARVIIPRPAGLKTVRSKKRGREEREEARSWLFLRFAALDGSEESILDFAHTYGLLFRGREPAYDVPDALDRPIRCLLDVDGRRVQMFGELVSAWRQQICDVKAVLHLWECVSRKDTNALRECIFTSPDEKSFRFSYSCNLGGSVYHTAGSVTIDGAFRPEFFQDLEQRPGFPRQTIKPARMAIQALVDHKLRGHVAVQHKWNKDFTRLQQEVVPLDLLGEIWLQLSAKVTESANVTLCAQCGKVISRQRSTRQFCSDACRMKFARKRKEVGQV